MRQKRTIYFNDARHYYLFVMEPPMTMEDAWRPVDEVAGTAVDTFIYGVARGDGAFYVSDIDHRFGEHIRPFETGIYWRVWENMQSLIDRGLDPLRLLVDRAHDKGMDFFSSLRMPGPTGLDPSFSLAQGGRGLGHPEVRDHQFAVLEELATKYPVEGVELDFAFPGGGHRILRPEDVPETTPLMTEYVKRVSEMVRGRPGKPGQVGVRVLPTEEMNLGQGLDVRAWLENGSVDFVVPLVYDELMLDPDMPFDWLIEAAHEADAAVYGMLQPYVNYAGPVTDEVMYPTPEHMRATQASYRERGVDGLYTWFMSWPLGDAERRILTEMGDADLIKEADKRYVVRRGSKQAIEAGYGASLPVRIPSAAPGRRYSIPFYIADDVEGASERIREVRLRIRATNLVSGDKLTVLLNGKSLAGETCTRDYSRFIRHIPSPHLWDQYTGMWMDFNLREVRPRKGQNILEISLDSRPDGLVSGVTVEDVEVIVSYGPYPSGLGYSHPR